MSAEYSVKPRASTVEAKGSGVVYIVENLQEEEDGVGGTVKRTQDWSSVEGKTCPLMIIHNNVKGASLFKFPRNATFI